MISGLIYQSPVDITNALRSRLFSAAGIFGACGGSTQLAVLNKIGFAVMSNPPKSQKLFIIPSLLVSIPTGDIVNIRDTTQESIDTLLSGGGGFGGNGIEDQTMLFDRAPNGIISEAKQRPTGRLFHGTCDANTWASFPEGMEVPGVFSDNIADPPFLLYPDQALAVIHGTLNHDLLTYWKWLEIPYISSALSDEDRRIVEILRAATQGGGISDYFQTGKPPYAGGI